MVPVFIVRQKWARLLWDGSKTVETRSRRTKHTGVIGISISGPGGSHHIAAALQLDSREGPQPQARFDAMSVKHLIDRPNVGSASVVATVFAAG